LDTTAERIICKMLSISGKQNFYLRIEYCVSEYFFIFLEAGDILKNLFQRSLLFFCEERYREVQWEDAYVIGRKMELIE